MSVPKKALIKLRSKPVKPKRMMITVREEVHDGAALSDVLGRLGGATIENCHFLFEYYGYDGGADVFIVYERKESDEEFEERVRKYKSAKEAYDSWYEDNKDTIEKEKQRRIDLADERKRNFLRKEKARLDKALKELEK